MHIGPVAHFVDVGVTRNVKGCQKLQSGWPTHFVDQHICWCGWCSVTVQFVVSGLLIDTICWSGDVFRINILRKRPILLVHLINIHNGYAFRNNILCLQNQHSVPSESTFWFGTLPLDGNQYIIIIIIIITIISVMISINQTHAHTRTHNFGSTNCTSQIVEIVHLLIRICFFFCNFWQIVPESTHLLIRIWLFNSNFLQIWLIWFCLKSESRTSTKIKARFYYPHQFLITILSAWSKKLSFCLKSPNVWRTLTQQSSDQTGKHRGEDGELTRLPSAWMRWRRHSTPRGF